MLGAADVTPGWIFQADENIHVVHRWVVVCFAPSAFAMGLRRTLFFAANFFEAAPRKWSGEEEG